MRDDVFERLYEEHAQRLLAFLSYRTGDRALAEDLLAETFERVLRTRRGFDRRKGSEKAWLYTIALNRLRDHARKRSTETRALAEASSRANPQTQGSWIEEIETRDVLRAALAVLSSEERESIALRYGGDLTMPEIASLLGQKVTTIEGRVYRGLEKLRADLGKRGWPFADVDSG